MGLQVVESGALTTVQDLGRAGYEQFGVPQSGAMDEFALRAANRLVGNPPGAAVLEFALQSPVLRAGADCLVAAAGRGFRLLINKRLAGAYRCAFVRAGETIHFAPEETTGWGYLAVSGGIDVPLVMGSRSTFLRGSIGGWLGRALQPGDDLPVFPLDSSHISSLVGSSLGREYRLPYVDQVSVPVILGPQQDVFGEEGLAAFLSTEYLISSASDRMGYRLSGQQIPRQGQRELLSEGIAPGSIQVPPGGQPIVLLSDRPTTGGYAKIATVASAGLPLLVQAVPGVGRVRFEAVSVEEAQAMYRQYIYNIDEGIQNDED